MSSAGVIAISPICKESMVIPSHLHSQESILIYVAMSGSMVPMRALEYDLIDSVKIQIQTCKGFVVKNKKLVCGGRELARSNSLVRDYGVGDGNVLHLVLRLSDLQVINVKTASGEEFTFNVDRSRDVGYVKRQIAKKKGALGDIDEQEVLCNGERLEDQRLINDICKNTDAVIHLFVRKSAKIRARPVEKNFELSIVAPQLSNKVTESRSEIDNKLLAPREPPDRASILEPITVNPKIEVEGLDRGHYPIRPSEGTGGAYFMLDATGSKKVSVFKPIDEEPMAVNNPRGLPLSVDGEVLKKRTRVGEGALRE